MRFFLNLCSGTGSVSRPFVENGWEVIEMDISRRHAPTHVVDLNDWDCPYETGFFDVIWASPDCTQYSRTRTTAKEPRNLEKADRLVKRCLELFFICNHVSGSLKTQIRACWKRVNSWRTFPLCVLTTACTARPIEKEHAYGRMQTGRQNCVIDHI